MTISKNAEEEFVTRGLKSAEEARQKGEYYAADGVLLEMKQRLEAARKASRSPREDDDH